MIVGDRGPAVVISAETAYYLERFCKVTELRVRLRGRLPVVGQELMDLREVAMGFDPSQLPEAEATTAEVGAESEQWMTPQRVADLEGITDRAVRLACDQGRIDAERVGNRWRIHRDAYQTYRAARAA